MLARQRRTLRIVDGPILDDERRVAPTVAIAEACKFSRAHGLHKIAASLSKSCRENS
jgi:hypothetical protein